MEIHHIKAKADGGDDSFGNAIPLCFDCHAEVRQYDPRHPKGIKFSEKELILHRDNWYKKIKQENQQDNDKVSKEPVKMHHEQNYQHIMLHKANTGNDILFYLEGALGIVHDEQAETLEEAKLLGEFVQYLFDTIVKRNNILYNMSLPAWRAIFLPYSKKPYFAGFAAIQ